jgi:Protein of unknown function (DUF2892).
MNVHAESHSVAPIRHRLAVNITPVERLGRVAIGVAAMVAAVVLLSSAASTVAVVLEVLLAVTGLDLAVTGALGHCPLYQTLGFVPKSLRRPS